MLPRLLLSDGLIASYQVYSQTVGVTLLDMQRQELNLARLHRECELNYSRLMRLIAGSEALGSCFSIQDRQYSDVEFKVIEVAKFTSALSIVMGSAGPQWLPNVELKVRVYHDAKMAEVIEWCSDRTIPWDLVERKGLQSRDEKWQWNIFLSELLSRGLIRRALQIQSR